MLTASSVGLCGAGELRVRPLTAPGVGGGGGEGRSRGEAEAGAAMARHGGHARLRGEATCLAQQRGGLVRQALPQGQQY